MAPTNYLPYRILDPKQVNYAALYQRCRMVNGWQLGLDLFMLRAPYFE